MRAALRLALGLAVALGGRGPAAAQEAGPTGTVGQAPISGGDRARARERALDEALRLAIEQAAQTLLDPALLKARSSDLRLRVFPRARSYILNYRILEEGEVLGASPPTFQVRVLADVATDRLAAELGGEPAASPAAAATQAQVVLCVVRVGTAVPAVEEIPPAEAVPPGLARLFRALGVAVTSVAGCRDEARAAAEAQRLKAQAAVLLRLELDDAGEVRATTLRGAHVKAVIHLIEPDGRVSVEGTGERDAYGDSVARAAARAAGEAIEDAGRQLGPHLKSRWTAGVQSGAVVVVFAHRGNHAAVEEMERALAGLPGVTAVHPQRVGPSEVEYRVVSASGAAQLQRALERRLPAGLNLTVKTSGDRGLRVE